MLDSLKYCRPDIADMAQSCLRCGICVQECAFLERYGNPGNLAESCYKNPVVLAGYSFECSLCGLCASVCPEKLDPSSMFRTLRKELVKHNQEDFKAYQSLLNYEAKGTSEKYTLYHLPEDCDTVFFPGCTLPGTRPDTTLKTYEYLQRHVSNLGIILDCCSNPSHDLGRDFQFQKMFSQLKTCLLDYEITTVVLACPNCYKIFNTYAGEFEVKTVYEIIAAETVDDIADVIGELVIHDPCPTRFDKHIQDSVRSIIRVCGFEVVDTPHSKDKTFCCGEGGGVACMSPDLSSEWTLKRVNESEGHRIATYCAGCVNMLSKNTDSFHLLDLFFDQKKTLAGKAKVSRAPFTYWNRLKLKKKIRKLSEAKIKPASLLSSLTRILH